MTTTRENGYFDRALNNIADDLALYLHYVNLKEFDAVLDAAVKKYNEPLESRFWYPIYVFIRQRAQAVQKGRQQMVYFVDNAPKDHKPATIPSLVQDIFSDPKGTWYPNSLNTILMSYLIEKMDSHGVRATDEMKSLHMDMQEVFIILKHKLIFALNALNEALKLRDITEQNLKLLDSQLSEKQAELEKKHQEVALQQDLLNVATTQLHEKIAVLANEIKSIQEKANEHQSNLYEVRKLLIPFSSMSPAEVKEVQKVMESAGLDYIAERNKQEAKRAETLEVCRRAAANADKEAAQTEEEKIAKQLELEKQKQIQQDKIKELCSGGKKEKMEVLRSQLSDTLDRMFRHKANEFSDYTPKVKADPVEYKKVSTREGLHLPEGAVKNESKTQNVNHSSKESKENFKRIHTQLAGLFVPRPAKPAAATKAPMHEVEQKAEQINAAPAPVEVKKTAIKSYKDALLDVSQQAAIPMPPPPPPMPKLKGGAMFQPILPSAAITMTANLVQEDILDGALSDGVSPRL